MKQKLELRNIGHPTIWVGQNTEIYFQDLMSKTTYALNLDKLVGKVQVKKLDNETAEVKLTVPLVNEVDVE